MEGSPARRQRRLIHHISQKGNGPQGCSLFCSISEMPLAPHLWGRWPSTVRSKGAVCDASSRALPALRTVCTPSPVGRALYACPVHPVVSGHAWNARPTDPVSKQETAHIHVRAKEKGLPFGSPLCWHYLFSRPGQAIVAPSATVRGTVAGACCLPELKRNPPVKRGVLHMRAKPSVPRVTCQHVSRICQLLTMCTLVGSQNHISIEAPISFQTRPYGRPFLVGNGYTSNTSSLTSSYPKAFTSSVASDCYLLIAIGFIEPRV